MVESCKKKGRHFLIHIWKQLVPHKIVVLWGIAQWNYLLMSNSQ